MHADLSAVQLDQALDQRQSKAQAAFAPIHGFIGLRKWLKQARQQLRRNANSGVRNSNDGSPRRLIYSEGHLSAPAFAGELGRVLQKVSHHLRQACPVGVHGNTLGRQGDIEMDFVLFEKRAVILDGSPHQISQVERLALQPDLVPRDAGHV